MIVCPACRQRNPPDASFCLACGSKLLARGPVGDGDAPRPRDGALRMIGDVAQQVGLSLRTVRYYEEMGLVNPSSRTQGGFRLYSEDDVRRLYILKGMKPAGMTLEEIRELMNLLDRTESLSDPSDVAGLLAGLREYEARTEEAIDRLERHLVEVRKLRDRIRKRMSACEAWLLETVEQPG